MVAGDLFDVGVAIFFLHGGCGWLDVNRALYLLASR